MLAFFLFSWSSSLIWRIDCSISFFNKSNVFLRRSQISSAVCLIFSMDFDSHWSTRLNRGCCRTLSSPSKLCWISSWWWLTFSICWLSSCRCSRRWVMQKHYWHPSHTTWHKIEVEGELNWCIFNSNEKAWFMNSIMNDRIPSYCQQVYFSCTSIVLNSNIKNHSTFVPEKTNTSMERIL